MTMPVTSLGSRAPIFVILLRFSQNRELASRFLQDHNEWIKRGFDDGVFLLVGSLQPNQGGAIVAAATSRSDLETRLRVDPFVAEGVVSAEVLELSPSKVDPRLAFMLG